MSGNSQISGEVLNTPANLAKPVFEAMQQGASACLAVPQKLMQANLEAMMSAFGFINRCVAAQSDAMGKMGSATEPAKAAEIQRAFLEAINKDSAEEVGKLAEIARKNFTEMSSLATAGFSKGFSPGNSF